RRVRAVEALGKMGARAQAAVEPLIEVLEKDKEFSVRVVAAQALGHIGPAAKKSIPALITASDDKHTPLRLQAVVALGRIDSDSREVQATLGKALRDKDEGVCREAAKALVGIGKAAVPTLVEAVHDKAVPVCLRAIVALGQMKEQAKEGVSALSEAVRHKD